MFILFRSVTFNLHDLLCSKKKELYLAFVRIFVLISLIFSVVPLAQMHLYLLLARLQLHLPQTHSELFSLGDG